MNLIDLADYYVDAYTKQKALKDNLLTEQNYVFINEGIDDAYDEVMKYLNLYIFEISKTLTKSEKEEFQTKLKQKFLNSHEILYLNIFASVEDNSQFDNLDNKIFLLTHAIKGKNCDELMEKGIYSYIDLFINSKPEILPEVDTKELIEFFFLTPNESNWDQRFSYHAKIFDYLKEENSNYFLQRISDTTDPNLTELLKRYKLIN